MGRLADAGRSRGDVVSRDSISRAPVNRDMNRSALTDRSSGLRGSDSVARQIARPSDTADRMSRSIDGLGRSSGINSRGTDSPVARSRDTFSRDSISRSGDRLTRAPEISQRTRNVQLIRQPDPPLGTRRKGKYRQPRRPRRSR